MKKTIIGVIILAAFWGATSCQKIPPTTITTTPATDTILTVAKLLGNWNITQIEKDTWSESDTLLDSYNVTLADYMIYIDHVPTGGFGSWIDSLYGSHLNFEPNDSFVQYNPKRPDLMPTYMLRFFFPQNGQWSFNNNILSFSVYDTSLHTIVKTDWHCVYKDPVLLLMNYTTYTKPTGILDTSMERFIIMNQ